MSIISTKGTAVPSFANGYAKNASLSMFPNLWSGLVRLYVPSIGLQSKSLTDFAMGEKATLTGATSTHWVPGRIGWAIKMDGSNPSVDVVHMPTVHNLTIMAWIKANAVTGIFQNIAAQIDHYQIRLNDNATLNYGWADDLGNTAAGSVAHDMSSGAWFHLAITRDGTTARAYINGIEKGSVTNASMTSPMTFSSTTYFGRPAHAETDRFNGFIDDMRIYKRAVLPWELKQIAAGASPLIPTRKVYSKKTGAFRASHFYHSRKAA